MLKLLPADEAAGEGEEAFVDVVAAVCADEQPAAVVEPGEGALHDPTVAAESGSVLGLAASDQRLEPVKKVGTTLAVQRGRAVG